MPARSSRTLRVVKWLAATAIAGATAAALLLGGLYLYLSPRLPEIDQLRDVQLQEPLRVYSRGGELLAVYGTKRRRPLPLDEIPERLQDAFIAAEDDRFHEHPGVDWMGLVRAGVNLIMTGEKGQGGSTITMQVARNFFLSREKTYLRKINEIFLALKIEREIGKGEILELYLNKIYLGQRAYGVGAAAQVYYGREIGDLTLAETAMIAGLPKAPSSYNPVSNPTRALQRRNYVLRRMHDLEMIDDAAYEQARSARITAATYGSPVDVDAPFIGEMARREAVERFGNEAYTGGYSIYTTAVARDQQAANEALRSGLLAYEQRRGFAGPVGSIDPAILPDVETLRARLEFLRSGEETPDETGESGDLLGPVAIDERLGEFPAVGGIEPALVIGLEEGYARVYRNGGRIGRLPWSGMDWVLEEDQPEEEEEPEPPVPADYLGVGDVVHVVDDGEIAPEDAAGESADDEEAAGGAPAEPVARVRLVQIPEVEGAFVALDPDTGALRALAGGFSFQRSNFNRATQARRQPGSNFKPFIYSAALDKGYTPATLVNDAPIVFDDPALEDTWRPENYSGRVFGPTRLREGLVYSRNLVSIRVLLDIGIPHAIRYVQRFGFPRDQLPHDLTLALGSAALTPLQVARGYSVIANGGFLVDPYLVDRIEDGTGEVLFRANPARACPEPCELREEATADAGGDAADESGEDLESMAADAVQAAPDRPLPALEPRFADRAIERRNAYIVRSFLRDVARRGTGRRTRVLGRDDLGGKTGTTDDQLDAWFSGFGGDVVATAWVGYDELESLGPEETGARAALPMWIDFMRVVLDGVPEQWPDLPPGMVTLRIDPETGEYAGAGTDNAVFEMFRAENAPEPPADNGDDGGNGESIDQNGGSLF